MKVLTDITTNKILAALATLAALTAAVSIYPLCFVWFYQPKMPMSMLQMSESEA